VKELNESPSAETVLVIGHGYFTDLLMTHIALPNVNQKVKNYSKKLTFTLQNCGYHKFILSTQSNPDERKAELTSWEFLEIQKDEHLYSVGSSVLSLRSQ